MWENESMISFFTMSIQNGMQICRRAVLNISLKSWLQEFALSCSNI